MLKKMVILLAICIELSAQSCAQERQFEVLVVPSLMDIELDGWYKIPHNSGPYLHRAEHIVKNQLFNLFIVFNGYAVSANSEANLTYDVQIYAPDGSPTEDAGQGIVGYQGQSGNGQLLLLNQQTMQIMFTDDYAYGTYQIAVSAYDNVSGQQTSKSIPIDLTPLSLDFTFTDMAEADAWMMNYYREPDPFKAPAAMQLMLQIEPQWIANHLSIISFFSRIFADNPYLLRQINLEFARFSPEQQKRFLMIDYFVGDNQLSTHWQQSTYAELSQQLQQVAFPALNEDITSGMQLDMLWSEFLATGKYEPISKIVSALALVKYKGTLENIKQNKPELTDELKRHAYLDATYQSAVWSLLSNNKQIPLVNKYCHFIYQNEELSDDVKQQLALILRKVQLDAEKAKG